MLTRTIIQVGHDLGIEVVAEGIERPEQLELLREMGCGLGQGYLIAGPMDARGVEALIAGGWPGAPEPARPPTPATRLPRARAGPRARTGRPALPWTTARRPRPRRPPPRPRSDARGAGPAARCHVNRFTSLAKMAFLTAAAGKG